MPKQFWKEHLFSLADQTSTCVLQFSWASLVAQMVKNLPEMWETGVRSLG